VRLVFDLLAALVQDHEHGSPVLRSDSEIDSKAEA
jgi:hypothetical protein